MSKTIIFHIPTGREFESDSRVTRCPFGKNRKIKPTDSIYNEVCDGCADNYGGWQNSQEILNRCYYEKTTDVNCDTKLAHTPIYQHDMLHCSRHFCSRRNECYRYWLGQNCVKHGHTLVYTYVGSQIDNDCPHFLDIKNY